MSGYPDTCCAVLFDMDGVVVDSMEHHARTWIKVFSEYGVSLTREDIFQREGMSGLSSIKDIFREKGYEVPRGEDLKRLQEKKLELFEQHRISLYPEIREILDLARGARLPMALVTGSLRRSVRHVLPLDIMVYFSAIITVEDIENGKPAPEPYIKAMEKLYCTGKRAIAVENAPLGIASAKSAGLECYALETTLKAHHLAAADKIFTDHHALFMHMKEMLQ